MYIIVQLHHSKSVGVKGNQMDFIFFINNGKDCSESIVWSIRDPVSKDGSKGKYLLERVKSITIGGIKIPENIILGEMY